MFGICVENCGTEVSSVKVSRWGELGFDFIGNGELRSGVRAAMMMLMIMTIRIRVVG